MILVTGATGNIGGKVVSQLIAAGEPVRVFGRDSSRLDKISGDIEKVVGDFHDCKTLETALKGVDRAFLLTPDTQSDQNILSMGARTGLAHIVKLSTQEAGWTPIEGHGHWHYEREELIRGSGIGWTFLRPTMFMSTALGWAKSIKTDCTVRFPGGNGRLAPVDPGDVAAVAATCLVEQSHKGKGYELTGSQLLSFGEMTEVLSHVLGKELHYEDISEEEFATQLREWRLPEYVVKGLMETFLLIRKGRFAFATNDVQDVLGRPPCSFEFWCNTHAATFK